MPDLIVVYIVGYNVQKNTGRNKATREKAAVLSAKLGEGNFSFLYPGGSKWRLMAYVKALFFDFQVLRRVAFVDKNARILQRTTFLPLTNLYLWIRKIPIVYELHADFADEIKHYQVSAVEKLVLHIYALIEKMTLAASTAIIYNHPVLQQLMQKKYRQPSIWSYNGANVKAFYPLLQQNCRQELQLSANHKYYLFIGALAPWRGIDLLIEIFKNHMSAPDKLLIVGDANHAYGRSLQLAAAASGNIVFVEQQPVNAMVKWINAADICLVPVNPVLSSPGNPLKLYDYAACGKPIAGQSDVIGCSDEIEKYQLGIVADFFKPAEAAALLRNFCASLDPEFFARMNRHVAVSKISWEARIDEWLSFLNDETVFKRRPK